MDKLKHIKEHLEKIIKDKQVVFLITGDKGSTILINIINGIDDRKFKTIFIDTGFHFDEILNYIRELPYEIEIIKNSNATLDRSVDMDKCCEQRKVEILRRHLADVGADCLIVPFIDEEKKFGIEDSYLSNIGNIEIIRPLSNLTDRDIWVTIKEHKMPFSKIYNRGYRVVDCKCCTTRTGRKVPQKEVLSSEFDSETIEKLKSLGYM